jgi:intracellular sulfur oxidation DsrE/DsrF family protein
MMPVRRTVLRSAALLSLLAVALVPGLQAQTGTPPQKYRLLIQVSDNDPARWNMVMNNVRNAQADVGGADKIDLEIVAYGPGISMLKSESPVGAQIADLVKSGVKVVGCENTMKAVNLTKAQMLPTIGYVPAAVTEIMKKQMEGWPQVRP